LEQQQQQQQPQLPSQLSMGLQQHLQPQLQQQQLQQGPGRPGQTSLAPATAPRLPMTNMAAGEGANVSAWQLDASLQAAKAVNLTSTQDFPTLGGTSEERVVMADSAGDEGGFWGGPLRPVKVASSTGEAGGASSPAGSTRAIEGPARQPPRQHSPAIKAGVSELAETPDKARDDRRTRLEELTRQFGLSLEEPVLAFLLTLSNSSEVLHYLQAYYGDDDAVRRFAEVFAEQGLGATLKEAAKPTKDTTDGATLKVNRRRRGKGREVDPSLLGFTATSSRIMQGSIDHGD